MDVQSILGQRGHKLLVLDNYRYYKLRYVKNTGEVCWRCSTRGCTAKLYTEGDSDIGIRIKGQHCHASDSERMLARRAINNKLRNTIINEQRLLENSSNSLHSQLTSDTEGIETLTPRDIIYIGDNLNRAKLIVVPKSAEEVHQYINSVPINTVQNENFILINDELLNIIVFSCDTNLEFLCAQPTLYVDGSSDRCTEYFLELFVIFGIENKGYVPLAFCVLKNKEMETYSGLFRLVKRKCEEKGLRLEPDSIVMNLDAEMQKGAREVFPDADILVYCLQLAQDW
ncbi:hypothetical protein Trydic_g15647 [Trypoxylus dichotomus]